MATSYVPDLFRAEIIFLFSPPGIYSTTGLRSRLQRKILDTFRARGIKLTVIEPGGRGAVGPGDTLKALGLLVRVATFFLKALRRQRDIEYSENRLWLFGVHVQCFTGTNNPEHEWRYAKDAAIEVIDALKIAEQRIRVDLGEEFLLSSSISVFVGENEENWLSVSVDPGVLEDTSRRHSAEHLDRFESLSSVSFKRRLLLRSPKIVRNKEQGRYPEPPFRDLKNIN